MSTNQHVRQARRAKRCDFRLMERDDYWTQLDDEPNAPTCATESVICSTCNGSGEGMYDGSTCRTCRGDGEVEVEVEPTAEGEDE